MNRADRRAERSRGEQLELLQLMPDKVLREVRVLARGNTLQLFEPEPLAQSLAAADRLPHLQMPAHHEVLASDVLQRRLH